jgi:soluble lytic murein transglycosylase-like protein
MGMFDDFGFGNPNSMALLGALAGIGQAAAPSRMPVSFGQVLGSLAGGLMQGSSQGYANQASALKNTQGNAATGQLLDQLRQVASYYGAPAPTMDDLRSGKFEGLLKNLPQTPITQPAAPAPSPGMSGGGALQAAPAAALGLADQGQSPAAQPPGVGGALPRAAAEFAQQHGVDPNFYTSVIDAESSFNPLARNPTSVKGEHAIGIAQFMPSTAKQYGVDPLNAGQALEGGARYFADLLKKHEGNYIQAAQSYGTLPKSLDNLNPKQQRVLQVAQALNSGQSFTDAGPAAAAAQQPAAPTAANVDPIRIRQALAVQQYMFPGTKTTPALDALVSAGMMPQGSLPQQLLMSEAMKAAGLEQQNVRQGGAVIRYNPATLKPELVFQNPRLGEGQLLGPGSSVSNAPGYIPSSAEQISAKGWAGVPPKMYEQGRQVLPSGGVMPVPGYPESRAAVAGAEAGARGQFEPQTFYDPYGRPYQGTRAQLPEQAGGLTVGGRAPGAVEAQPPGALAPGAAHAERPEAAAPTFPVTTPAGPKDIAQVSIGDMFPGGQGVPRPPAPPSGSGFGYGPPTEIQKEIQKEDAQRVNSYSKEASENQKVYQDLSHLRDVLDRGLKTGRLTPLWTDMTNIAHQLGADAVIPKNYDPADAAVFSKAGTDLVFAAVKKLAGQVRVAEIEGYKQANPSLTLPLETNYNIINDILSAGKWQDSRAKLANEFITQYPGAPLSAFDAKFNEMAPLSAVTDRYRDQMIRLGAKMPGQDQGNQARTPPAEDHRVIGGKTYIKQGGQWYRQD